jgi:hypothetical protein
VALAKSKQRWRRVRREEEEEGPRTKQGSRETRVVLA